MVNKLSEISFAPMPEPAPQNMGEAQHNPVCDDRTLIRAVFIIGFVMMIWRLYVGLISHVIWEESHFVVSGQHLALGYPDIPAGFAWLARLITTIFGWHVLPLRLVSLAIATAIPYGVYFMATPIVSRRNAIWAAMVALFLPTATLNGTVYYPEGSLQLLLAVMLGCFLRAVQNPESLKWWAWTGVCAAVGILVHFRFLVPGLAVIAYLTLNARGRGLWTRPGLYLAGGIALAGLLPALVYNGTHGWPAIQFHVVNRVKIDPNPKHIISFIETQIGITTPLFFTAMVAGLVTSLRRDRDQPGAALGFQGLVIFLFYCLQAIVNKKIMTHWPFMSYVPLVPYVPGVLIGFVDGVASNLWRYVRMGLVATGPLLAIVIGVLASGYQYLFVHSAEIPYTWRQANILKNENWTLLEPDLAGANARAIARFGASQPDGKVAWAASGHISAVHMEFPGVKGRQMYTLDEPYDVLTSRFVVARHDWGLDRAALMQKEAGKGVVLALIEPSYVYHDPEQVKFDEALCKIFDDIEPYKISTLPPGKTAVDLFTARVRATPLTELPKAPCALVPALYIAHPLRGEFVGKHDNAQYFGIAADPIGVTKVDVLIDHKFAVATRYGLEPEGFHTPAMLNYDPNWPKIQYDFKFPPGSLTSGQHVLSIQATRSDGSKIESDPRILYVK